MKLFNKHERKRRWQEKVEKWRPCLIILWPVEDMDTGDIVWGCWMERRVVDGNHNMFWYRVNPWEYRKPRKCT